MQARPAHPLVNWCVAHPFLLETAAELTTRKVDGGSIVGAVAELAEHHGMRLLGNYPAPLRPAGEGGTAGARVGLGRVSR
jgi:hypothetical protein